MTKSREVKKIKKIPNRILDDNTRYERYQIDEHTEDYLDSIDDLRNLTDVDDGGAYHLEDVQSLDKDKVERNFKILANKINEIIDRLGEL